MILEVEALTNTNDIVIDYIELNTPEGTIAVDWDTSEISRSDTGFVASYKGVYFNNKYANGEISRLKDATISDVQIYTESDEFDGYFELTGFLSFYDDNISIEIPVSNRNFNITVEGERREVKIAVTGHRPKMLWGYDLNHPKYLFLKDEFKKILIEKKCSEAITGMALGADMVYALAVLELKEQGYDIKLHCAVPCEGQSSRWSASSQRMYQSILDKADKITWVSHERYRPELMHRRNCFMVDEADMIIAVWNGENSGTGHCVSYAQSQMKTVICISPDSI